MCGNITEQLLKDVCNCITFSLKLDESTDIRDTANLLLFIRMIFEDFSVRELLNIFLPVAIESNFVLGHLHETFRFISVTRFRTVGWTPWTSDQFVVKACAKCPG
jgi:hypothetical protein